MKYIMQNMNFPELVAVHESNKAYRCGNITAAIPESRAAMWKVVCEGTSNWFEEKLMSILEEEFMDFQGDNDIHSGDLPPELENTLADKVQDLKDIIATCKAWQLANK